MTALIVIDLCLVAGILLVGAPAAYLLAPLAAGRGEGRATVGGALIGLACAAAGEILGGYVGLAITR